MDAQSSPSAVPADSAAARSGAFAESKKALRTAIRTARRALPDEVRAQRSAAISEAVRRYLADLAPVVRTVAAYCSAPDEPDTEPLLAALAADGIQVYVPVCEPEYQLSWVRWVPGVELVRSPRAPVMEPVGPRRGLELFDEVATLFIPALAIDADGLRLGQGGGYYDRFLPRLEQFPVQVAALVYDEELVASGTFSVAPHDMPVDLVITPGGARHFLD